MENEIRKLEITHVREPDIGQRAVDVIVPSTSRPDLLKQTLESFKDHVKFNGRLRFFLEEANMGVRETDPTISAEMISRTAECVRIADRHGFTGVNVEDVGSYSWALTKAMDRWITSPYMFNLEDDWLCIRDIPLDLAVDAMEQNEINQIRFNKRDTMPSKNEGAWIKVTRKLAVNGQEYIFTGSDHWYFNPALWRMEWIRPRWEARQANAHWYLNNHAYGPLMREYKFETRPGPDFYADVLRFYIWGGIDEKAFFRHLGVGERSTRNKYGTV